MRKRLLPVLIATASTAAVGGATAGVASARHGADDPAGHVRHARGADDVKGHHRVRHGRHADDGPNHR
jgi:hypothetical protein